ncbi:MULTISPECIES: hypothetical protein [unclassified Acinetobacter]|nr:MULTISPECIES: hypothetical protein [unclassified Acinetobacter]MDH0032623.1 hypothetical protein [Acinetobacter sp. GD04021]MDH0886931.1 hypothetical protein [Acinetobacter sp. GD03873]MDH1083256.1 hypothetical protein [Acinetobacter sp. GD03983]MDH2203274.1 hypothetical protein [Acinetobacter sp. GD03647]MDH2215949.1 hypothetical protein [Acinetobacter sp. GD03641]
MLPNIPATKQPSKSSKIYSGILYFLILSFSTYTYKHIPSSIYFVLLALFLYIFISYQSYIEYHPIAYKDLKLRRFIGFNATLKEVTAILNPTTDYHYQIKIHTSDSIPQDQQQEWLITPNLYPMNLRALMGHSIYVESLANSHLIFNIKPYLLDQNQQEIFFTQHHLEYPKANTKYKKCRYNNIQKVELDTSQIEIRLFIWVKQQNIQIKLNETQLKLMEIIFFPKLLMFSQRQYLAIKNQQAQGIIWQS